MRKYVFLIVLGIAVLLSPRVYGKEKAVVLGDTVLDPVGLGQFFVLPKAEFTLRWKLKAAAGQKLNYTIKNYEGEVVLESTAVVAKNKILTLPLKLNSGYYDITFPDTGQTFGICALPEYRGQSAPFFAIDTAMSWLVKNFKTRDALVKILQRYGFGMARERLSWGGINPEYNKWNWEPYENTLKLYQKHGVKVLELFHSSPAWLKNKNNPYPADLVKTYEMWKVIGRKWDPYLHALEVWNEPNLTGFGGGVPADQYLPVVKTIAYAFYEGKVNINVGGGVFSGFNKNFVNSSIMNGLLDTTSFVSFHTYHKPEAIEGEVNEYRNVFRDKELWITESGQAWTKGPGRPPVNEGMISALDITMKAIEAKACGISRYFAFVYPYYEEGRKNFGMMGKEETPLRSMVAYIQSIKALSHKEYIGDLIQGYRNIKRARVFANAKEAVIVLYTGKIKKGSFIQINQNLNIQKIEGIDGRNLLIKGQNGRVDLSDGLVYLWVDRKDVLPFVNNNTKAMELYKLGKSVKKIKHKLSSVVFQPIVDNKSIIVTLSGYKLDKETTANFEIKVRAWNLSKNSQEIKANIVVPKGVVINGRKEIEIKIPGLSSADIEWPVSFKKDVSVFNKKIFVIEGLDGENIRILPVALTFIIKGKLEDYLRESRNKTRLVINNIKEWERNIAPTGIMKISLTSNNHWLLSVNFPQKGDNWVYPKMPFPEIKTFTPESLFIIRARAKKGVRVRMILWEKDGSAYFTPAPIIPADNRFHTAVIRYRDFSSLAGTKGQPLDTGQVKTISIGMNSRGLKSELEVSGAYIVNR